MERLHKDQRGFTILELVIVMLLTGIITAAITTSFFQVFEMHARTTNHMTAVSQVQQAGKVVSEDMLQSRTDMIDDSPEGGEFLILGWIAQDLTEYKVVYTLEDMSTGDFRILRRKYYVDSALNSTSKVAEYINPAQTSCECSCVDCNCANLVLTFAVTATVGDESEQRIYRVQPRPGS